MRSHALLLSPAQAVVLARVLKLAPVQLQDEKLLRTIRAQLKGIVESLGKDTPA